MQVIVNWIHPNRITATAMVVIVVLHHLWLIIARLLVPMHDIIILLVTKNHRMETKLIQMSFPINMVCKSQVYMICCPSDNIIKEMALHRVFLIKMSLIKYHLSTDSLSERWKHSLRMRIFDGIHRNVLKIYKPQLNLFETMFILLL